MQDKEFLEKLKNAIQTETPLSMDTDFDLLDEWDSLGMMSVVILLENDYNFKTTVVDLLKYKTPREIYNVINVK